MRRAAIYQETRFDHWQMITTATFTVFAALSLAHPNTFAQSGAQIAPPPISGPGAATNTPSAQSSPPNYAPNYAPPYAPMAPQSGRSNYIPGVLTPNMPPAAQPLPGQYMTPVGGANPSMPNTGGYPSPNAGTRGYGSTDNRGSMGSTGNTGNWAPGSIRHTAIPGAGSQAMPAAPPQASTYQLPYGNMYAPPAGAGQTSAPSQSGIGAMPQPTAPASTMPGLSPPPVQATTPLDAPQASVIPPPTVGEAPELSAAQLGLAPPPVTNSDDATPDIGPAPPRNPPAMRPAAPVAAGPPPTYQGYPTYPSYPQGPYVAGPPQAAPPQTPGTATPRVASRPSVEELQSARILARVDGAPILEGDIIGMVNQVLEPRKDQMSESDYKEAKKLLTQRYLRNAIEMKMLYNWFFNTIPADKREKALATAWEQVGKTFDQNELPKMLERAEVQTALELDAKLREIGHSLAKQRRAFGEKALGTHVMLQNINRHPEVSYDEMIEYYRDNESEFTYKARARWEQLTVLFSKHSRTEARTIIGQMGDAVFYGTPFPAVAKKGSEGFRGPDGGLHDWTQRGSLRSTALDEAIFTLPLNKLSDIVEDDAGYHIIRVLDREDAGKRAFRETQLDIKEKIQQEKRERQMQEFLKKVRSESTVTTIYDNDPEGPLMERGNKSES